MNEKNLFQLFIAVALDGLRVTSGEKMLRLSVPHDAVVDDVKIWKK